MAYGQILVLIQRDKEIKLHWCKKVSAPNMNIGDFLDKDEWNLQESDWRVIKIFRDEEWETLHEIIGKFGPQAVQSLFRVSLP